MGKRKSRPGWLLLHIPEQPCPGKRPKPLHRADGHSHLPRSLLLCQPNEEPELHHLRIPLVKRCEPIKRYVQLQQLVVWHREGQIHLGDIDALELAAAFEPLFAAGTLDENAPHRFSRRRKEKRSVLPPALICSCQAQPRLMDERAGLKRVAGGFAGHLVRCQSSQFFVNQWEQLFGRLAAALLNGIEDASHIVHAWILSDIRTIWNR